MRRLRGIRILRTWVLERVFESGYPEPQANLAGFVCASGNDCSADKGLALTVARFKTPVLRDLEDSAPYFS